MQITASGDLLALLQRHAAGLKEIINVSAVFVVAGPQADSALSVAALPAGGHKCARCWNFMPEVANYGIWQNVCTRCQGALKEMGINPRPATTGGRQSDLHRAAPPALAAADLGLIILPTA